MNYNTKKLYMGLVECYRNNAKALEYATKVTTLIPNRPMHVNVIYNNVSGGRSYCTMFGDDSYICYAMEGANDVLNHEAGGHGIGKSHHPQTRQTGFHDCRVFCEDIKKLFPKNNQQGTQNRRNAKRVHQSDIVAAERPFAIAGA